jgi:hypothetical protein
MDWTLYALAVLCTVGVVTLIWMLIDESRKRRNWSQLAVGVYERVEYGVHRERHTRSRGRTEYSEMISTVFHLDDGRAFVFRGRRDAPYPRGAQVRIEENLLGGRRLRLAAE